MDEFPVESIRARREDNTLRPNGSIKYTTVADEVLRNRSERARMGAVENEEEEWEIQAMGYFKDRLDALEHRINLIASAIDNVLHQLDSIEDAVAERSEANVGVTPVLNVTISGVSADIAADLQRELQTRVERIMAHHERAGRNNT